MLNFGNRVLSPLISDIKPIDPVPDQRRFRLLFEFLAFACFFRLIDLFPETFPTSTISSFARLEVFARLETDE